VIALFAATGSIRYAMRASKVDGEHLYAALSAYLLAGLFFGILHFLIEQRFPGSFSLNVGGAGAAFTVEDALYFSFVTLATLGYGDIVPLSQPARGLAIVEAVAGQLYLAVMVARLVSRSLVIVDEDPDASTGMDAGSIRVPRHSIRYRLLDSIRAFALEAMADAQMSGAAQAAHAAWFANAAGSSTAGVRSGRQAEHLSFARAERANLDAALMGELQGVAQQIDEDLLHLLAIAEHHRRLGRQPGRHGQLRARNHRIELGHHFRDQLVQVELADLHRHLSRLDPGDVEDLVDDRQQVAAIRVDAGELALDVARQLAGHALQQHVGVAEDRVERRPELVRHVRQKLRLQPRRLLELDRLAPQ
jgi:hypothetical protein